MTSENDDAQPLFTFAIITDTHVRPPGGDDSSPFPVNDHANDRARYAIHALARHNPAFTIHLGDMVHPLPHLPTYAAASEEAKAIFAPLLDTMHFVPGNHDIGDKPMTGSPAGAVDEETAAIYASFFGDSHYSFDHNGIHVVVINSSLAGSGNDLEHQQRKWLEDDLNKNAGKRTLLFSHYPPFIDTTDEPLHYDNYDLPAREWLLGVLEKHDVEAVFSGHVHQFFYNRVGNTQLYCLPPTSFTRQDYAEIYPIGPTLEFGRNDLGKFCYALVDVHENGHRLRVIPTEGRKLAKDENLQEPDPVTPRPSPVPMTVHMRHAWARATDLPYNGPMEEFARKRARDDYVLLRLLQMGVTQVRTPLADLLEPDYARRVQDFAAAGIRFTFFGAGVPSSEAWQECISNAHSIDAVEIVASTLDLSDLADTLPNFTNATDLKIHLGKFHSSAHEPKRGSKFAHTVSYGFKWDERAAALDALKSLDTNKVVSGIAFQINLEDDLLVRLTALEDWSAENDIDTIANIRLANVNPAVANFDDELICARIEQAVSTAQGLQRTSLQLDTYADIDRGYQPRNGLIDRHSNFRAAGRFLANQ